MTPRAANGAVADDGRRTAACDLPDRPLLDVGARDEVLVPPTLPIVETVAGSPGGRAWLSELPNRVRGLRDAWSLRLAAPLASGSVSWVGFAWTPDDQPCVLKIGWPHRENAGEAEGLRMWDGGPAVKLLRATEDGSALLLERCVPGTRLADAAGVPVRRRLLAGAELLTDLWSVEPPASSRLDRLADITAWYADLLEERAARLLAGNGSSGSPRQAPDGPSLDPGLPVLGVRLLRELPATASRSVVLHGDFNPGNVLAARRRPWVAIDAKPMVGDPGYDPWPLLDQIDDPFARADSTRVVAQRWKLLADAVGEDSARLHAWAAARAIESAYWSLDHGRPDEAVQVLSRASTHAVLAGL